eukprot:8854004-Pyramimonas_sp.AAC.1
MISRGITRLNKVDFALGSIPQCPKVASRIDAIILGLECSSEYYGTYASSLVAVGEYSRGGLEGVWMGSRGGLEGVLSVRVSITALLRLR